MALRRASREPSSALEARAKRVRVHEVRERALTVDLDDRQELAVARLELGVAADVDQRELEVNLSPKRLDDLERASAEAAVGSVKDGDAVRYGYRPRVVVASATRCTASP